LSNCLVQTGGVLGRWPLETLILSIDFLQPIVADAEAGFGGVLNAFELMKAMIEAGAAGVHFEDQLASRIGGIKGLFA